MNSEFEKSVLFDMVNFIMDIIENRDNAESCRKYTQTSLAVQV